MRNPQFYVSGKRPITSIQSFDVKTNDHPWYIRAILIRLYVRAISIVGCNIHIAANRQLKNYNSGHHLHLCDITIRSVQDIFGPFGLGNQSSKGVRNNISYRTSWFPYSQCVIFRQKYSNEMSSVKRVFPFVTLFGQVFFVKSLYWFVSFQMMNVMNDE